VLLNGRKAFPLAPGHTLLDRSDYGFLARFLDVTKANMFFARGLLIVEGDAENILLPTLARIIGRGLTQNGVSIVNVGGTGLRRFARIYMRAGPDKHSTINVPVACVADFDVMPDCAPEIIGRVKPGDQWPEKGKRRWRARKDFALAELSQRREAIKAKASGQHVETFLSDHWTLEYDLAAAGLAQEVWIAAHLAAADEEVKIGEESHGRVALAATISFSRLTERDLPKEEIASHVYALFQDSAVSKATAAQYLSWILDDHFSRGVITAASLRERLPPYLVKAIEHVTAPPAVADADSGESPG
jgi:putative ATP-dependent endonuclease of the OLD family